MNQKELDNILAMPLEERKALRQKIIEEMGDDWEKELNTKNLIASLEFSKKHQAQLDMVNIDELKNISNSNILPTIATIKKIWYNREG